MKGGYIQTNKHRHTDSETGHLAKWAVRHTERKTDRQIESQSDTSTSTITVLEGQS